MQTAIAQVESYLGKLDQALSQIPASSRAEIILEIKSHILDAQERDPECSVGAMLDRLGKPEVVASKYLLERGLMPIAKPKRKLIRWFSFAILGTLATLLLLVGIVLYKFTPIVDVDNEKGTVKILGGLISVNEGGQNYSIGDEHSSDRDNYDGDNYDDSGNRGTLKEQQHYSVDRKKIDLVDIEIANGKLEISPSDDDQLEFVCNHSYPNERSPVAEDSSHRTVRLNLAKSGFGKCEVKVPRKIGVKVRASNGKVDIRRPQGNFNVEVGNGNVAIEPDGSRAFRYDLSTNNGSKDHFESSQAPDAFEIRVFVGNGNIIKRSN